MFYTIFTPPTQMEVLPSSCFKPIGELTPNQALLLEAQMEGLVSRVTTFPSQEEFKKYLKERDMGFTYGN